MINGSSNSRYLLIVEDPQGRRTITLEDVKYSLGRKSDNQIVLRSKHASRYHATLIKKSIDRQNFSYWILDGDLEGNKSHNGLYVNGAKCLVHELKDGDLINFGCEINASFHLIANQERIEQAPVKSLGQLRVDLTENEANYSQNNFHAKSTLILHHSPSQTISFDHRTQDESFLDDLTDLPNHSLFNEYLSNAINNAQKTNQLLGLLLVDVEGLRNVNNRLGYRLGDKLLKIVSERLRKNLRSGDIVARWGGDEFIILLPQINNANDLEKVSQRIIKNLEKNYEIENHSLAVRLNLGSVICPSVGTDRKVILQKLEENLVAVKNNINNNSRIESVNVQPKNPRSSKVEYFLYQAIRNNELALYYQPQVNITQGQVEGLEVLLRWLHPQFGLIAPHRFLPLVEESELIFELNRWVLKNACQQAQIWQQRGLLYTPLSINLSPHQLRDPQLLTILKEVLTESKIGPFFLEMEITETSLLENSRETSRILGDLQKLGISITLDDFGSGYASIAYLGQFPVKKLKIEQSLTKNLTNNPQDTRFIASLLAIAKGFNLIAIAKGVETQQQLEILQELGCERMQGNRISGPLAAEEMTKFLHIHRTLSVISDQ
ncbi:phytochrome-like protein cph2 [Microcystis aeruginosa NIES-2519]|jgi:diguanylate cyclase (GGDEF)-like protein|uniref:Phytochrome-like protein cph2 n=1 Tax=Microcystis aeruginosa NIES-2519 TaxID=2303981 RepID=A0A5A5R5A4_MICAE|nr:MULTISPECIES: EAL domain-containing protein [Microcystis]AVQ74088.1 diguanylate cyclase [Microcystis sp. MC19]CCI31886.1 putative diguanylate cyclase/phosphodiesterase [Microcystis sp. T1-4]GCA71604.1 phytochrome-like protein cph2 [Microcystis aeruginosa NIES-2519]GCA83011.1 phytochrome-like protein cph2 [Microcystis aeruginosa NIES-2522]GCA87223.1 phytochrome-like protein cph2 [Microcystis aeruginosa NIES-4264]